MQSECKEQPKLIFFFIYREMSLRCMKKKIFCTSLAEAKTAPAISSPPPPPGTMSSWSTERKVISEQNQGRSILPSLHQIHYPSITGGVGGGDG